MICKLESFSIRVQKESDPEIDTINNGRVGFLTAGKEGRDEKTHIIFFHC